MKEKWKLGNDWKLEYDKISPYRKWIVHNPNKMLVDYPLLYQKTGKVVYDYPADLPKAVKSKVEKIMRKKYKMGYRI